MSIHVPVCQRQFRNVSFRQYSIWVYFKNRPRQWPKVYLIFTSYSIIFLSPVPYHFQETSNELTFFIYVVFLAWRHVGLFGLCIYKSPPKNQIIKSLWGENIDYGYERSIEYTFFEEKLHKEIKNFSGFTLTFSSAMNAITNLLLLFNSIYSQKFNTIFTGGYFESVYVLNNFQNMNNNIIFELDVELLLDYSDVNVYFFEATRYNMFLDTFNLEKILSKINVSPNKLTFIIIDTTLMGDLFPFGELLNKKSYSKSIVFINLRSALKLNQQGFEFSNVGLISFYYSSELE